MHDELGHRMKEYYEQRYKYSLQRRAYTIIRIDGKAFHTYTKNLNKPFDEELTQDMIDTTIYLCKNIQGAKFGYVQSDEISILLTDFDELSTQAWFDNNVQKMVSVSASLATAKFNQLRLKRDAIECGDLVSTQITEFGLAHFDSRVFQLPTKTEVENYFIWRQQDAVRNSISAVAQSLYSHKELHNKNQNEMQEMIFKKGINWNDLELKYKRGSFIEKVTSSRENTKDFNLEIPLRTIWSNFSSIPIFSKERNFLNTRIPNNE